MDRKELVKKLSEHFGVKSKYLGAPSFAYQVETEDETYTIDREGKIITASGEQVQFEELLKGAEEVINKEIGIDKANETLVEDAVVTLPMKGHSGRTLRNLVNMIYSKQELIKKALEIEKDLIREDFIIGINKVKIKTLEDFKTALEDIGENSCPGIEFDFYDKTITFKFEQEENLEKQEVFKQFIYILNENAKKLKHASAKVKSTDNEKYTFRTWLLRLGMIGDEYKMARKELLKNLSGNGAFRKVKPKGKYEVEKNN
ncbi:virulence-related protein [Paramaledivibacter caminithermalis]|jgi:hypothetical protein|uniref:Virulence-related protein n=1 Tax=Paramaledivibacter caminithermalis (strain DSM 15212 / CIP 107654 / DViRD3) TaxID=1121301 RepID=A0A1M6M2V4_PARC5|nr:virulence-related protein [Paramaledivibacter caminithermalis]SHJ77683.1 hypothetical protein SAMN02745912_01051 [Paramaledivibacter caminithermalis DSM 15212]